MHPAKLDPFISDNSCLHWHTQYHENRHCRLRTSDRVTALLISQGLCTYCARQERQALGCCAPLQSCLPCFLHLASHRSWVLTATFGGSR